jgi:hypothetical protein
MNSLIKSDSDALLARGNECNEASRLAPPAASWGLILTSSKACIQT